MILARTAAMAANRWADAAFDASNPRTARRAIPTGQLTPSFVAAGAGACSALFNLTTAAFWSLDHNPYPLAASPAVLLWITAYSFTKRITWLCHLFLGSALALSPLAAALATSPQYLNQPDPYFLAVMVAAWVAGFDIIYSLQDLQHDRQSNLHSAPSRLGPNTALWLSRSLHALALLSLTLFWQHSKPLGYAFAAGIIAVAILLSYEHWLVWKSPDRHIHRAFLTVNGIISLLLGALGILDVTLHLHP
jgi:4-hydroxybenzoate polyprenyltransferase